jgi:hypothetical protein
MAEDSNRGIQAHFVGCVGLGSFSEPISPWNFLPPKMLRIERISALK